MASSSSDSDNEKSKEAGRENGDKKEKKGKGMAKKGAGLIAKSGDFFGRLGTLMVMLVSTSNTVTIMVTSFVEEVYWRGGIHAALLVFIHLPVLVVMIWLLCKARFMAIYHKVRPAKDKDPEVVMTDLNGEVKTEKSPRKDKEEIKKDQLKKLNQLKKSREARLEKEAMDQAQRGQHINQAFEK